MNRKLNILIYRLGSMGDTIMALPCFHAVRNAYPDAHISLLTNKPVSSKASPCLAVLGNGYLVNEVIDYPAAIRNPFFLVKLAFIIRKQRFGYVINLTEYRSDLATKRDAIFFRFAGAKKLVGFNLTYEDKKPLENLKNGIVEWEASRLARRVSKFKKIDLNDDKYWDLRISENENRAAQNHLSKIPKDSRIIAFSVGTKLQANEWGIHNWLEFIRGVSMKLDGWTALFLGSVEDKAQSDICLTQWQGDSLNLCGITTPRETAAILNKCKLFVGHDSGPMHLAACMGTPVVAIFSSRNYRGQWYPKGSNNYIFYHDMECAGCNLEMCFKPDRCTQLILPETVVKKVTEKCNK